MDSCTIDKTTCQTQAWIKEDDDDTDLCYFTVPLNCNFDYHYYYITTINLLIIIHCIILHCIVFIHFYSASHSMNLSEALLTAAINIHSL